MSMAATDQAPAAAAPSAAAPPAMAASAATALRRCHRRPANRPTPTAIRCLSAAPAAPPPGEPRELDEDEYTDGGYSEYSMYEEKLIEYETRQLDYEEQMLQREERQQQPPPARPPP